MNSCPGFSRKRTLWTSAAVSKEYPPCSPNDAIGRAVACDTTELKAVSLKMKPGCSVTFRSFRRYSQSESPIVRKILLCLLENGFSHWEKLMSGVMFVAQGGKMTTASEQPEDELRFVTPGRMPVVCLPCGLRSGTPASQLGSQLRRSGQGDVAGSAGARTIDSDQFFSRAPNCDRGTVFRRLPVNGQAYECRPRLLSRAAGGSVSARPGSPCTLKIQFDLRHCAWSSYGLCRLGGKT